MSPLSQGPIHCAATIVREEGPRGLWSGASPTVLRNGTNQMCLFWAKNHMDGEATQYLTVISVTLLCFIRRRFVMTHERAWHVHAVCICLVCHTVRVSDTRTCMQSASRRIAAVLLCHAVYHAHSNTRLCCRLLLGIPSPVRYAELDTPIFN